jgi:hypothetical protein
MLATLTHLINTACSGLKAVTGILTGDAHSHHVLLWQPLRRVLDVKVVRALQAKGDSHVADCHIADTAWLQQKTATHHRLALAINKK